MKVSAWILAARPKTLTAALIPILVASALAKNELGKVNMMISLCAFLAALSVQIGTNFINDALDFKKGVDTAQRLGPVRAVQSGALSSSQVLWAGALCFFVSFLFGIPLIFAGGLPIAVIMIISILCGYSYTGGPFPISYKGLGDFFVFIFFGMVAVVAVYYLQGGPFNFYIWLTSIQIGMLSTVMIAINNLRDIQGDRLAGKLTLAVRFGKLFSRLEISALILFSFGLNLFWIQTNKSVAFLPLMTLPLGVFIIQNIWKKEPGPYYNVLLGLAALLHFLFGTLLSIALVI